MAGVKEVGKYNVAFAGISYDGNIPYEMVIIEEFDGNTPVRKKTLYFRRNVRTQRKYIMPDMGTEAEVETWLQYRNRERIQIYNKQVVETVK